MVSSLLEAAFFLLALPLRLLANALQSVLKCSLCFSSMLESVLWPLFLLLLETLL